MSEPTTTLEPMIKSIHEVFSRQQSRALEMRAEKVNQRARRLKKLQLWIEKNQKAIADAIYRDFKKPAPEVMITEIYPIIMEIKHALSHLKDWTSRKKVDAPLSMIGTTSYIKYEPKGVCLIMAPWNYPFNLTIAPLVSALAAGNTVILKPSEMTPYTADLIDTMIGELFTEEEVRVFNGDVEMAQTLLKLPFDHIFFTGSPAVGKLIMKAATENLTSVTLELGGKCPAIIDDSANLKDAAQKIAWGKFTNCGQTCIAPDYLLVHHEKKTAFTEHLKTAILRLFNHNHKGFRASEDYARLINKKHFERVNNLIKEALDKGAELVIGGDADADDCFIPPTVLANVPDDTMAMKEEIFGPLLPIVEYHAIEDAVNMINNKPKPLALYYFGQLRKNKNLVLNNTSSGGVCINDCLLHFSHPHLPFGGIGNSGIGKSHGWYGFQAFSNEKPVLKQLVGLTTSKMVYPPYSNKVKQVINLLTKYF